MASHDFLIIGGGIFGLSTALALAQRNYSVALLNPDTLPHHLAASTDISKIVRMEYGTDLEYFRMAEKCMEQWHTWNELLGEELYHEVGLLMLCQDKLESEHQQFEYSSVQQLQAHGYATDMLDARELSQRFPVVNTETYGEAHFNPRAGWVESGKVIDRLAAYVRSLGVEIYEGQTADHFIVKKGQLQAVKTREGKSFSCGHAIVAAGASTPYLLPELQPYIQATGHPVFWLKPKYPAFFQAPKLAVFTADIANTGWYGFPLHPKQGVVKIAKHTDGLVLHPDQDDRQIRDQEVADMRDFVEKSFPQLVDAPLVYTRRCLYTDTLDGHFWIDQHPEIKGLSVSTGGSGHGMKMGPIIGEMTADMAEGKEHEFSARYRWRHLTQNTPQVEEARFVKGRKK
jgi:glycine/D-amino acid oxidase-like deaminating enzyme